MQIRKILTKETLKIRHEVMWPNKPLSYVKLPNDDKGVHYGLFKESTLISVISLFVENNEVQFRKFATLKREQGKGFGSVLLKEIFKIAESKNYDKIWCNARLEKSYFYAKFGLQATNITFSKGGVEYVIMEKILKSTSF